MKISESLAKRFNYIKPNIHIPIVFSFLYFIKKKLKKRNIFKSLLRIEKKSKEELRIFMFLDLKSSTSIAENLGHILHSEFIQDCFHDLNEVILKHKAEIYQYVGDEAVITWYCDQGTENNNCVELFFTFEEKLKKRAHYYQEKYRIIPVFKAGLHGGKLMSAEVGTIKREKAFHGDVINTAAHIQSLCNVYHQKLIISQELLNYLPLNSNFKKIELEELTLKGKRLKTKLIGIKKTSSYEHI